MAEGAWDHIVIGAGSAGCVMARRLADAGRRVLLFEAGGRDNYHWVHIPMGYLYCIGNPRTDWMYRTEADAGLNGRSLLYPRGKLLGGCSSINGMLYLRGQAADYDGWRQMGLTGWGWDDVLPYFMKSEDYAEGADEMHGAGGEWRVEEQRLHWQLLDDWRAAAVGWGLPAVEDFNRGNNEGVGYFRVNQRSGWRINTAKAFLRGAPKGRIKTVTGAHVLRLLLEDGRCVGVAYEQGGRTHEARAGGEVILSAGAVNSPQILQLSGLGPARLLAEHGIDVRADLPEVGANLQDHLQLRTIFKLQGAQTLNTLANSLWGKLKIGLEYALKRSGPMSMAPSQLGAFSKSRPELATPDLEYHVQPLSLGAFGEPLHDFPAMTTSVCNLRPESRGRVTIKSADPKEAPAIAPNYLSTDGDRAVAVAAIRQVRELMARPELARYAPEEMLPGGGITEDGALAKAAGDIGTTIFHPTCTIRMGMEEAAPLDGACRLKAVGNLRVVDASVMPKIVSGNTNSPTIMIAEKVADMMLRGGRAG